MKFLRRLLAEWHLGRAMSKFRAGDFEGALSHIDLSLKLKDDIRLHAYKAMALARLNRSEDAVEALNECYRRLPADAPTLVLIARACMELGMLEHSKSLCEEALKLSPNNTVAKSLLILTMLERGEMKEALAVLRDAHLADDPLIMARILTALEDYLMSRPRGTPNHKNELEEALGKSHPSPKGYRKLISWLIVPFSMWRVMRMLSHQKLIEAIKTLTNLLHLKPDDFNIRFMLGMLLLDAEMPELASSLLREEDEQNSDYHLLKGAILIHLGELEEAKHELELSDKTFSLTHYCVGLYELRCQRRDEAITAFSKAYELDPPLVRGRILEIARSMRLLNLW
jgi:tetratricopeptide (TPR) repeat protein